LLRKLDFSQNVDLVTLFFINFFRPKSNLLGLGQLHTTTDVLQALVHRTTLEALSLVVIQIIAILFNLLVLSPVGPVIQSMEPLM
jgi:hypothetical protein